MLSTTDLKGDPKRTKVGDLTGLEGKGLYSEWVRQNPRGKGKWNDTKRKGEKEGRDYGTESVELRCVGVPEVRDRIGPELGRRSGVRSPYITPPLRRAVSVRRSPVF
jgi:hypothetical protein